MSVKTEKEHKKHLDFLFLRANVWEAVTFAVFFVNQAVSSGTQALVADLKVIANI